MRLLQIDDVGNLSLTDDLQEDIPAYAILSHTWGNDKDEVTSDDLKTSSYKTKAGYVKIRFCGEQAKRDGFHHFWVDTCCILRSSSAELQEAINSMFRWYQDSARCYVYMSDVSPAGLDWSQAFKNSRWFKRGWTLQELLAPSSVDFFSTEWQRLGDKTTLEQQIHEATTIPIAALRGAPMAQFSIKDRMQWAERRHTKRKEDKAYCLLGIFDVSIPMIYGEGDNAFVHLKEAIASSQKGILQHQRSNCFQPVIC
jgi:hypothetical protein